MKAGQIKKDIQAKVVVGMNGVGEDTKTLFRQVLFRDYYNRYAPQFYLREGIMQNEIQKSPVVSNGSGASVEVYYDAGAGGHVRPVSVDAFGHEHPVLYSEEDILNAVMAGYHTAGLSGRGAKTENTWFKTLAEFDDKKDKIILENLQEAGLPIH